MFKRDDDDDKGELSSSSSEYFRSDHEEQERRKIVAEQLQVLKREILLQQVRASQGTAVQEVPVDGQLQLKAIRTQAAPEFEPEAA
jgi:hypothetical protein